MAKKRKYSPAQSRKFAKVMREGYSGELHSGSDEGPVVRDPQQIKAIAASEAGVSRKKRKTARKASRGSGRR